MKQLLTIISISTIVILIVLITAVSIHRSQLGGSATIRDIENSKYYILTTDKETVEVMKTDWYINKALLIAVFLDGILAVIGAIFLGVSYFLPFISKISGVVKKRL